VGDPAVDTVCRMSVRGLVVALLCGLLGIGAGVAVAYAVSPRATHLRSAASPVPASSPSVPIDVTPSPSVAPDIDYPALLPGLALPVVHSIRNDLASWTYHVPFGWTAYAVCTAPPCALPDDAVVGRKQIDKQTQLRFRPAGEPTVGGYSLRVKIIDNADLNPAQLVATKVVGFRQEFSDQDFSVLRRTPDAVYFTYIDGGKHLRYNFFQWFAVPDHPNATLEMSVSGRARDQQGLEALFNRFADNLTGSQPPRRAQNTL
jgi:hypothetical protein